MLGVEPSLAHRESVRSGPPRCKGLNERRAMTGDSEARGTGREQGLRALLTTLVLLAGLILVMGGALVALLPLLIAVRALLTF